MLLRYVIGNLLARRNSNLVAVLSIALVFGASVLALAFYDGLKTNMRATGRPDNVVVMRSGVLQTSKSTLPHQALEPLKVLPQVAQDNGEALVSPESNLEVEMTEDGDIAPVRGVDPIAFQVHDQVKVAEGRSFAKGSNEVILGKKLVGKAPGWKLGGSIKFNGEDWPVVGVFTANGSALEGEVWADRSRAVIQLKRPTILSAVIRARSPEEAPALVEAVKNLRIEGGTGVAWAISEREYYETTVGNVDSVTAVVGGVIAILIFGAIFAAANTLHASLSSRMSEFAALWVVGNRRSKLVGLIVAEALILCGAAGLLGCLLAGAFAGTQVTALLGGDLEFAIPFGAHELAAGLLLAGATAVAGAVLPAFQVFRRNLAADLG